MSTSSATNNATAAATTTRSIAIVGAGLAGSLLACLLAKRGFAVTVYERRPDPRARGFIGGRSINLALSTRGISALRCAGLADRVLAEGIPMRGRMMHAVTGDLTFQAYSKNPNENINAVSRGGLNLTLLDAADAMDNVTLRFALRCTDVDLETGRATFHDETIDDPAGAHVEVEADLLIGADGAFSAVRSALQRTDRADYAQSYLEHGYKELTIPPAANGDFAMNPHALHIWPRGGSMMIALPNQDKSFTCTLFWPFVGAHSFAAVHARDAILPFFRREYADAVPLMPALVDDFERNPTSSLVTIRCFPWHACNRVLLLGDAAHAIVPFYGQGMNAAFEDCEILDRMIGERMTDGTGDWFALLEDFSRRRKPNADAIADMALMNFIEMRDHVGSRWFLFKKKFEKTLHQWFPARFMPLYNMVSFSTIPYAEALRRARQQRRTILGMLTGLMSAGVVVLFAILQYVLRSPSSG
jgi:kynurenine 3-monooxygenase